MHLRFLMALALPALASSPSAQITYFSASLDGAQENPPVTTTARGWGVARLDQATGNVSIFVSGTLTTATAAHMHQGAVGVNGGIVVPLTGGPKAWTGAGTLTPAQVGAMLAGGMYVNVHTPANPGGEIRGQLLEPASSRYVATLDGSQEVPPTGSAATGTAICFLHEPDNVLTYVVTSQGLTNVAAAHIHIAPAGSNGGIIHPLTGAGGSYCGVSQKLDATQLAALKASGLYVNIHTSSFPGGEIRGQILPAVADFSAAMDGAQEVPPVPTGAIGEACLLLNPDATLTYRVVTSGLAGTAAHVHKGAVGMNGGIEIPLSGGPTVWSGTSGVLTPAQIADARNGLWYVNVHTAANPGGEIRGQVRIANLPTTYGGACPGSAGNRAEIGSGGAACIGSAVAITLHGARATTQAAVQLGLDRETISGLLLPLDLGLIQMPDCYLLHDLLPSSLGTTTDGNGCATRNLALPLDGSLRGLQLYASWFIIDPGANPLSVVTSNGLCMRLE